jgi:hypothetical protein
MTGGMNGQNRTGRFANDLFGDAPQGGVHERPSAMRADHDQVDVALFRKSRIMGISSGQLRLVLSTGGPVSQTEYQSRQNRNARELWHSAVDAVFSEQPHKDRLV